MIIIPLPSNTTERNFLKQKHHLFRTTLNDESPSDSFLLVQDNRLIWINEGTISGKVALQISRQSVEMHTTVYTSAILGNVGFLGKFSCINDVLGKYFKKNTKNALSASNMKLTKYSGSKLKSHFNHYDVIMPLVCALSETNSVGLDKFFHTLGWNDLPRFTHQGGWSTNKQLFIDGVEISSLESWFQSFLELALPRK